MFGWAALPWAGVPELEAMRRMQNREKLERPALCPQDVYDVLLECWRLDVSRRAAASKIVSGIEAHMRSQHGRVATGDELEWPELQAIDERSDTADEHSVTAIDLNDESVLAAFRGLEIGPSDVQIDRELGRGQFGAVCLARLQRGGQSESVAVKMLLASGVPETEQRQFEYEAKLLSAMRHRNIVTVVGVCFQSVPNMLVLELMGGGDLREYLRKHAETLVSAVGELSGACLQIADAMAYLERRRVVHRDLAARNVLVGADGLSTVKLSDVGLSRTLASSDYYRKTSNMKVPIKWMAPESILERLYTSASDVWSFGVLCWEVYSLGIAPYPRRAPDELVSMLLRGERLPQPDVCPSRVFVVSYRCSFLYDANCRFSVLLQCWELDGLDRPSFQEVLRQLERVAEVETRI